MPRQYHNKEQANQYDKIFRENMDAALPGIIEHLLGLDIVHSEEIDDDIQHTKERKPDLLKKVTDRTGNVFILHLEYQVKNENEMVFRMVEYRVMLQRKYGIQVRQFVLFMGSGKPRMATEINEDRLKYSYQLIALSQVDYKIFLRSDKPEEKMLAILANFENDSEELALQNILKGVQGAATGDFAESRYFKQLRILAQLRKLDVKFVEAMESITKFFKEEKDPLFRRGEAKGKMEIALEMKKEGIPVEQIAKFTKLSVEEINKL